MQHATAASRMHRCGMHGAATWPGLDMQYCSKQDCGRGGAMACMHRQERRVSRLLFTFVHVCTISVLGQLGGQ